MKKFNVKKAEKELTEISHNHNITTNVATQVVINNMMIYNTLLDQYVKEGKTNNIYLLYQMSSTIFKQLKEYKIVPSTVEEKTGDEDAFQNFVGTYNKKQIEVRN
mgnify:CR=1 FL=1